MVLLVSLGGVVGLLGLVLQLGEIGVVQLYLQRKLLSVLSSYSFL